jgi:hypothetical protein
MASSPRFLKGQVRGEKKRKKKRDELELYPIPWMAKMVVLNHEP